MLFETDLGKDRGKKVLCCDLIFVSQTSCNGHYTINKKAFHSFKNLLCSREKLFPKTCA